MAPRDALNPSQGPRSPPGALSQPQPLSTPGLPCAKGVAVPGGGSARSRGAHSCAMAIGEDLRSGCFWRGVLAEAVGTFLFVGVVLGASAGPGPLAPALAGGLAAGGLVCTLGGPQANPALTLALLCTRKLGALRGVLAVLAQCAGASLAAAAARAALQDGTGLVPRVGTAGTALAWETFATFQLALAAFATAERATPQAGLALGSAVAAGALAAHEPRPRAGAGPRHRGLGPPLGVLAGAGAGRAAGRALLRVRPGPRSLPGEVGCLPCLPGRGAGGDPQPIPFLTLCPWPPGPPS
ncbi:aquaporin-1-like isoform X3 [Corapipo altera]|uniref:aquaporin-1-like isoform X3 n=1 Tax=Corapipo altera TaxID=415028 RepID=UPI000FD62969|nr:aquaporin-1-like isoform X3 [Corapipo altera]